MINQSITRASWLDMYFATITYYLNRHYRGMISYEYISLLCREGRTDGPDRHASKLKSEHGMLLTYVVLLCFRRWLSLPVSQHVPPRCLHPLEKSENKRFCAFDFYRHRCMNNTTQASRKPQLEHSHYCQAFPVYYVLVCTCSMMRWAFLLCAGPSCCVVLVFDRSTHIISGQRLKLPGILWTHLKENPSRY